MQIQRTNSISLVTFLVCIHTNANIRDGNDWLAQCVEFGKHTMNNKDFTK